MIVTARGGHAAGPMKRTERSALVPSQGTGSAGLARGKGKRGQRVGTGSAAKAVAESAGRAAAVARSAVEGAAVGSAAVAAAEIADDQEAGVKPLNCEFCNRKLISFILSFLSNGSLQIRLIKFIKFSYSTLFLIIESRYV